MTAVNTGTEVTDALATEALAFRRKLPQLLVRYEGESIALYRGRVVGHGANDEELAERIYERLGDVSFYIARVERQPTVYDLPSLGRQETEGGYDAGTDYVNRRDVQTVGA